MKALAVILFHNDEDIVEDQINYMIKNKHDVIVFDHGSTDNTVNLVNKFSDQILKFYQIDKNMPFTHNTVFIHISNILIKEYAPIYDWISFIESDEFLEGSDRTKSYYEHLVEVDKTKYNYIHFDNFVFWFTEKDDMTISSPRERNKYYAYRKNCNQRVYAWRAKFTNVRYYNHNKVEGEKYPVHFRTCHYEMRSDEHTLKKLADRLGVTVKKQNHHYKIMYDKGLEKLRIKAKELHYDDGSELIQDNKFDWSRIY